MSGCASLRSRLAPRRLLRRLSGLLRKLLGLAGAGQAGLAARDAFRLAFRGLGGAGCRQGRKAGRFPAPNLPASLLESAPFAATLRHWGLAEEEVPKALAFWRLEALAGFGLSAFALVALAAGLWTGQAPEPRVDAAQRMAWSMADLAARHLAHLAKASMALAGLALGLAACWRRAVIRRRRFVPFAEWICFWR